jgi:hypothetical protein
MVLFVVAFGAMWPVLLAGAHGGGLSVTRQANALRQASL